MNGTTIGDKPKVSAEEPVLQKSIQEKSDPKVNEIKDQKNVILSKLRKRKTESKSPPIDTIESSNKSESLTKSADNQIKIKDTTEKEIKSPEKSSEVKDVTEDEVQMMEVDSTTPGLICIRPDCNNEINRFYIFENKFCSTACAITQWTDDFRSHWSQK